MHVHSALSTAPALAVPGNGSFTGSVTGGRCLGVRCPGPGGCLGSVPGSAPSGSAAFSTSCQLPVLGAGFTVIPASWPAENSTDLPVRLAPRQHECAGTFVLPSCWSRLLSTQGVCWTHPGLGQETGAPCAGTLDYHCLPRASALPPVSEKWGWRRGASDSACSLHLHTGHSPGQARARHALCMAQMEHLYVNGPWAEGTRALLEYLGQGQE